MNGRKLFGVKPDDCSKRRAGHGAGQGRTPLPNPDAKAHLGMETW